MSQDILDAAELQQFKNYLLNKSKIHEKLTKQEADKEHEKFISEYFPGAKGSPTKIVELMASASPSKALQTQALVNPAEEEKTGKL